MRYAEYIDEMNRLESEKADLCKRMINDIEKEESRKLSEALYIHCDHQYFFDLISWKIDKMVDIHLEFAKQYESGRESYMTLLEAKTAIDGFQKSGNKDDLARFFDIVINNYEGWFI